MMILLAALLLPLLLALDLKPASIEELARVSAKETFSIASQKPARSPFAHTASHSNEHERSRRITVEEVNQYCDPGFINKAKNIRLRGTGMAVLTQPAQVLPSNW